MSTEGNKELLGRFWEKVFNEKNLALIDELFTSDWIYHGAGGQEIEGPQGLKQFLGMYFNAFPDIKVTLEDMIAEADKVVTRVTGTGTHKGELMGIPATGKRVNMSVICISRIRKGKIAEDWEIIDLFGMLSQLGVILPPGGKK